MTTTPPRSRVPALIGVIVVLVLVLAGGLYALKVLNKDHVALIGDSVTDITKPELHGELDGQHVIDVEAVGGMEVAQMQGAADTAAAAGPDQVVINLGTNDVIHGKDMGAAAKGIEDMAAKFPKQRCVHLVTVNEGMFSTEGKDLTTPARQLNQAIKQLALTKGYHVVDWADIAAKYAAAGEPNGHLTSDTIHPDVVGRKMLADAIRESVDLCKLAPL